MSTPTASGCEACNKSGLSLLLLRPSPIAKVDPLVPVGSQDVLSDGSGLVPAQDLTESRYVLRLLRAGYVHVYIPNPPTGAKNWLTYRVTDNADLIEQGNPVFSQTPQPEACARQDHNAAGMRLLYIPQAHKIPTIWIAYSANLWNDKLKQQNKANPEAMMQVDLAGGTTPGTFKPTADALRRRVLECALTSLKVNAATDHDFRFNSLVGIVSDVANQLIEAATRHPKTKGKELAVVLRDPVGAAAELNALRLRRHEVSQQYLLKPEVRQPLEVNRVIETLKGYLIADADARALNGVSPLQYRESYLASTYPPGTSWEALTAEQQANLLQSAQGRSWVQQLLLAPYRYAYKRDDLGRVAYPDRDQRAAAWAKKEADEAWAEMDKYYDESQRMGWKSRFEANMESLHLASLKGFEADWDSALKDDFFKLYFELHFDEKDSNSRKEEALSGCSSGSTYCREASLAYTPGPLTQVPGKTFEKQLDADITQPDAVMLRAVLANQVTLGEQLVSGSRSGVYDFMKGMIGEFVQTRSSGGSQPLPQGLAKAVSWLTNATLSYSAGLVSALAATAALSAEAAFRAVKPGAKPLVDPKVFARLERAQGVALIHRASEEALAAAVQGKAPNVPVLMMVHFDPDTAREIMKGRGQPVNMKVAREWSKSGRVTIGLITDADTIAKLNVDPGMAVQELAKQASVVRMQEQAYNLKAAVVSGAASGSAVLTIPVNKFMDMYEAQRAQIARAPQSMTAWLVKEGRIAGTATRRAVMSVDGRLAVGSMVVQGLGVLKALDDYDKSGNDADKMLDARLSIADGAAGFLGGFSELAAAGWEARLALTVGAEGAGRSIALAALRGSAYGMGFAGNAVNAWVAFRKAEKLGKEGNIELSRWMVYAGFLFSGGAVPLLIAFANQIAQAAIRAGLIAAGGIVTRQLARVVAIRLGTAAVGLTFPGVGWVLTVVAVGQVIYVVVNTPTPFQTWLKGCYFGKPDRGASKRGSWVEEEKALKQLENDAGVSADSKKTGEAESA